MEEAEVIMKTVIHKAESRGTADHGWLKSWHSFSFADYYDPDRIHFGALRVLNDDIIHGGKGFGTHAHQNMEIITIPLEGALRHRDSMGHEKVIQKGEVQIMSAGTGVQHSEFNDSPTVAVNLLQIWILPKEMNIKPRYDQKVFSLSDRANKFQTVVSPSGQEGSVAINQDAYFSLVDLKKGKSLRYDRKTAGNGYSYAFGR